MIYQHPLAYLLGVEGLALLRAWAGEGEHDERFVRRRIEATRRLLEDPELAAVAGVSVGQDATASAYAQWAPTYDDPNNGLFTMDEPIIDEILDMLPIGIALDAACGTGRLTARLAGRGFLVTGVDGSVEMLELAKNRVSGGAFLVGDLAPRRPPPSRSGGAFHGAALRGTAETCASDRAAVRADPRHRRVVDLALDVARLGPRGLAQRVEQPSDHRLALPAG